MGSNGEGGRSRGRKGKSKDTTAGLSRRTDRAVRKAARSADSASRAFRDAAGRPSQGPPAQEPATAPVDERTTEGRLRVELFALVPNYRMKDLGNGAPEEVNEPTKQSIGVDYVWSHKGLVYWRIENWPESVEFTVEVSWNGWLVDYLGVEPSDELRSDDGRRWKMIEYRMERA